MKHLALIALLAALSAPLSAVAHADRVAGTDDYLRDNGYTEEQLSTAVVTEDREPFESQRGAGTVRDEIADVLDRAGRTSRLTFPWGDITEATFVKNEANQTWDAAVRVGGTIPTEMTQKAQLFVLVNATPDETDNDVEGFRIGMDAEFSLQYGEEHGWYSDFRWYNKNADFWAVNKETAATFQLLGPVFTMRIPFTEIPADLDPTWRVVMAVAEGGSSEVDAAPGIGFPPPKAAEIAEEPKAATRSPLALWIGAGVLLIGAAHLVSQKVAKKRKK